jgi:hypothetical protein
MSATMTPLAFLTELSRKGAAANVQPGGRSAPYRDARGATGEARLLIRLLNALANDVGEFSMPELMLFDAHWLTVAVVLLTRAKPASKRSGLNVPVPPIGAFER